MLSPAFSTVLPLAGTAHRAPATSRRSSLLTPRATATQPRPTTAPAKFSKASEFGLPNLIPESGQARVVEILRTGTMFRYSTTPDLSDAAQAELAVAKSMGFKYCIGTNSCTSSLVIAMRVLGVGPGDKVLTNAFTFTAVPSSILAVSATPILVDSDKNFHMDIPSLREKLAAHPETKVVLLSHFRGRVSDCDTIRQICDDFGVYLVEDCAHCLGVEYKGQPVGRRSHLSAVSVQADKVVNGGEGGFVVTDNPDWAANMIYLSGAYERKGCEGHLAVPLDQKELIVHAMLTQPNMSVRMSNVTGALVNCQLPLLGERRTKWNMNGVALSSALQPAIDAGIFVLPVHAEGVLGVQDHYVFTTPVFDAAKREQFMKLCSSRGVAVKHLGGPENARYFKNWNYMSEESREGMERTAVIVENAWDMKVPLSFNDDDCVEIGDIMSAAAFETMGL